MIIRTACDTCGKAHEVETATTCVTLGHDADGSYIVERVFCNDDCAKAWDGLYPADPHIGRIVVQD